MLTSTKLYIMNKYLFQLSGFPNPTGWNHQTVLVSDKDIDSARAYAHKLKPNYYIGEGKQVDY